ncbi:TetR/AcrR family transcriptional regulator [Mechercharimyces sp. CAU 1602]|uniref:TetR/AcrR family transcriptional regulator n=1 Tax=Mechercharimyces sp. CAU 1602 TaxID=2973933 RepID=UPI002161AEEE|nr:TetR/AcrR family transcriptional regulator [Mechercharimyces sp. CAU 1602]MCS1350425.1 TetR/AcrR family transcriptional regulator [Mechercharimyces sp. CAU 1602]
MTANVIKEVSKPLFAQHGYEGTSLSKIADGVGIKKSSIYAHFENKEALFLEVLQDCVNQDLYSLNQFVRETKQERTESRLYQLLNATCQQYRDETEQLFWARAVFFPPLELKEKIHQQVTTYDHTFFAIVRELIQEGIDAREVKEGNVAEMTLAYCSILDGLMVEVRYSTPAEIQHRIDAIWNIFWSGIQCEQQSERENEA